MYPYSDWGYHYEIWCFEDESAYEHYKTKPRLLKMFSKKKSPYLVVSESRMMAAGDNKEFYIPDIMSGLPATDDEDAPLESQYKSKDFVKTEKTRCC